MRFEHFHYLFEISRCQSISAAAKVLQVKPSSLRYIIKVMEAEFGFAIFQRNTNGVILTAKGAHLIALAREMDIRYEKLLSLKNNQEQRVRRIRVLLSPSINLCLAIPLAIQYHQYDLPGNIIFKERQRFEMVSSLLENEANLGVTYLTQNEISQYLLIPALEVHVLSEDSQYLLFSKNHALAGAKSLSPSDIQNQSIATLTKRTSQALKYFKNGNNRFFTYSDSALVKQAILEKGMIGVMFGYTLLMDETYRSSDYCAVPFLAGTDPYFICLLHRREQDLRYQERILIHCIKEHFKQFRLTLSTETNEKE